jgi:nucleoside-diphosphate-sugar epimerase
MPKRRLSYAAAYRLGACLETVYGFLRKQAEPPMTRFVAAQLALDHWFDISAIKVNLRYKPRISTEAGLEQMRRHWHNSNPA